MKLRSLKFDGQKIRFLRQALGWTQAELAQNSKCSKRTIERAEAGGQVSVSTLKHLADALKVAVETLTLIKQTNQVYADSVKNELEKRSTHITPDFATSNVTHLDLGERNIAPSRLRHVAQNLVGRDNDLYELDRAWNSSNVHVLSIVAWGGVGKTSLVAKWTANLAGKNFDGARYFDWSFYSQGMRDRGVMTVDSFIASALTFFGDAVMARSTAAPWDKGARLAHLIAAKRTLLVLDGLEPLQNPPGIMSMVGEINDLAMKALLLGLAQHNPGLCIITTRERVADLANFQQTTAPIWELKDLSTEAGNMLLKAFGVIGSEHELNTLVKDIGGHALTLNLIGRYLAKAHQGDIHKRDAVNLEKADNAVQGGHAFKAMAAYEKWLTSAGGNGNQQLTLLRLLGLFDHPVEKACLAALRKSPVIQNLTESIVGIDDTEWNLAASNLTESGIISVHQKDDVIDAHPLVREYFATQLLKQCPEAMRKAHKRLFEYYKALTRKPFQSSMIANEWICRAITHSCLAGQMSKAWSVYWHELVKEKPRVHERPHHIRQKEAAGTMLAVLRNFFDKVWNLPSKFLSLDNQALVLGEAGHYLFILGRYEEAKPALITALNHDQVLGTPKSLRRASRYARLLRELYLICGDLDKSLKFAIAAKKLADQTLDPIHRIVNRAGYAQLLHYCGEWEGAFELFKEAEKIQAGFQPQTPQLFGVAGFWYCEFLIDYHRHLLWLEKNNQNHIYPQPTVGVAKTTKTIRNSSEITRADIEKRAKYLIETAEKRKWFMEIGFGKLVLGLAIGSLADSSGKMDIDTALDCLNRAVTDLRMTGQQHHLAHSLQVHAKFLDQHGDLDGARADLDEAKAIVQRSSMKIYLADINLNLARLTNDKDTFKSACEIVRQCSYWRLNDEISEIAATFKT